MELKLNINGREEQFAVSRRGAEILVRAGARCATARVNRHGAGFTVDLDGRTYDLGARGTLPRGRPGDVLELDHGGRTYRLEWPATNGRRPADFHDEEDGNVWPPVRGTVDALLVEPGDAVRRGQPLVVLDALGMKNEILAPMDGRVAHLPVRPGETVEPGTLVARLEK